MHDWAEHGIVILAVAKDGAARSPLAELKEKGIITQDEFAAQKAKLLAR